ncbi:MAG TPA: glucose 1-dehydrogenase [Jiangellaceae bacterium]|nr:glucose 1-dehydrogenase [Jiangellaceae bacterium]
MTTPTTAAYRLDGMRALVTGASRGIGAAVADALAGAGANLVLTARGQRDLEVTAKGLSDRHRREITTLVADLSQPVSTEELAERALSVYGGLDVLVNNAGISIPESVVDTTAAAWDATMAVNLRAPALLGSRIGAAMAASGGGSIVNIASAAALRALPNHHAYGASKAGLLMATKVLALELGPQGVRANTLCPTVVLTEMGHRVWGEQEKAAPMLARIPSGHFGVPDDVAHAVVFLASPGAGMVNGVDLPVDGGYGIS